MSWLIHLRFHPPHATRALVYNRIQPNRTAVRIPLSFLYLNQSLKMSLRNMMTNSRLISLENPTYLNHSAKSAHIFSHTMGGIHTGHFEVRCEGS